VSLINDALKRTRDNAYQNAAPYSAAPNYRPNATSPTTFFGARSLVFATVIVMTLALAVVLVSLRRVVKTSDNLYAALAEPEAFAGPVAAPRVDTAHNAASTAAPKFNEDQVVARVLEKIKADAPAAAPAPEPPKLVLQGITTEGSAREAMINGFTVHEGEEVEGARVVGIEARRVRLRFGEREVVLRMP
jgi:hypothetical protein